MAFLESFISQYAPPTIKSNPDHLKSWVESNIVGKTQQDLQSAVQSDPYVGLNGKNYYHYAAQEIEKKELAEGRDLTMGEQVAITDMMRQLAAVPPVFYNTDPQGRAVPRNFRAEVVAKANQSNWYRNMSSNALYSMAALPGRALSAIDPELGSRAMQHLYESYAPQEAPGAMAGQVIGGAWTAAPLVAGGPVTLLGLGAYGLSGVGQARLTAKEQRELGHDITLGEELTAAILQGGAEVGSGLLTAGLAKVGGKALLPVFSRMAPTLIQPLLRGGAKLAGKTLVTNAVRLLGSSLGEGAEEAATEAFQNYIDRTILDVKNEVGEGTGKAFKLGVATNLILSLLTAGRLSGAHTHISERAPTSLQRVEQSEQRLKMKLNEEAQEELMGQPEPVRDKPTNTELKAIHDYKDKLQLNDKEYRDILEKVTGKRSSKELTESEVVDVLSELGEAAELSFKEPHLGALLTDQLYEAERLGLGPLVKPVAKGRIDQQLEYSKTETEIDNMVDLLHPELSKRQLKKLKKRNEVPEIEVQMAKLLDTYEEAPDFLSEQHKKVFDYFRDLNRRVLEDKNAVRREQGLPEIPYREAYIAHIAELAEGFSEGFVEGMPQDLVYWAKEKGKTDITDKRDLQRQLEEKIGERFSTDLRALQKSMVWSGLKYKHMKKPVDHLYHVLDMAKHIMPASTQKWLRGWVDVHVKNQQTMTDEYINGVVNRTGLVGIFNKVLKPFGKEISKRPVTDLFTHIGKLNIYGAMAFRPKLWIRNKFQLMQNIALYGVQNTARALSYSPKNDPVLDQLLEQSSFLKSYTGAEELTRREKSLFARFGLAPYQWTAVTNAKQTMKAAYLAARPLMSDPKYADLGWADPRRTYTEPEGFLYPSEKRMLLEEMEFGASATQYQYIGMAMPGVFRHKSLTPLTRLQSWWMNYFFHFQREAVTRMLTGRTGQGRKIPASWRANWGKYMLGGGALLQTLGYGSSFLTGALPTSLSPTAAITLALYMYAKSDDERTRKRYANQIKRQIRVFVPGGLALKDVEDVWTGKKSLVDFFFYTKKRENKK